MKDLKEVYKASTEELALTKLDSLKEKWGDRYGIVIDSWYNNWNNISTFFDIFPTDEYLNKCVYLATIEIIEK